MVALSKLLREHLVPQQGLWSQLVGRPVKATIFEDNTATIKVAETGYSQQLRHMHKHHRISLGLVRDFLDHPDLTIKHIETVKQKGDLFTKGLSPAKHSSAMEMVRLLGGIVIRLKR